MSEFGQSLLAFMDDKGRPINEMFIYLLKSLLIVFVQFDFFPQFIGFMGSFGSFHIQITDSLLLSDCGVLGIGQRAGFSIAEAC